jgi:ribonuclease HI
MELTALVKALQTVKEPCRLEIFSDSKYLLGALTEEWISKWKRNGWRTASRQTVLNRDLWQELDRLLATHEPHFRWVKGHALTPENNRCDELAVAAANSGNLLVDGAYEAQNPFPVAEKGFAPHVIYEPNRFSLPLVSRRGWTQERNEFTAVFYSRQFVSIRG